MNKNTEEYIPFGPAWKKEMMKFTKDELIDQFIAVARRLKHIETGESFLVAHYDKEDPEKTANRIVAEFRTEMNRGYVFTRDVNPARERRLDGHAARVAILAMNMFNNPNSGLQDYWNEVISWLKIISTNE